MFRFARASADVRHASWLFCLAGLLAIVNAWLPGICPPGLRPRFTGLGLLDIAVAATILVMPWRAWPRLALLSIPLAALAVMDAFAIAGELPPWTYAVFLVVTTVWVGLALPRWSSLSLAPILAVAYVLPLLHTGNRHEAATTVGLVVPFAIVVGELIGHTVSGLRDATLRDELTGVGNRRHGMAALDRLRPGDAVLLLDLDRFKQVNDREGHAGGDAVLAELGAMLRRSMRGADAIARLGGEEFLVVASQAGDSTAALAERLVEDWRRTAPRTTISVGATVHDPADAPEQALARADQALYAAKRAGRDRSRYSAP